MINFYNKMDKVDIFNKSKTYKALTKMQPCFELPTPLKLLYLF